MTVKEAKTILQQAGEPWTRRADLFIIRSRVFDPIIKKACDKLILMLIK